MPKRLTVNAEEHELVAAARRVKKLETRRAKLLREVDSITAQIADGRRQLAELSNGAPAPAEPRELVGASER